MIIAAKKSGIKALIVPNENLNEARLVHGINVIGFDSLCNVIRYLEGKQLGITEAAWQISEVLDTGEKQLDLSDVKGQNELIDSVILAAAGGHNMLMIGEPGCGKTMIAQRIPVAVEWQDLPQNTKFMATLKPSQDIYLKFRSNGESIEIETQSTDKTYMIRHLSLRYNGFYYTADLNLTKQTGTAKIASEYYH